MVEVLIAESNSVSGDWPIAEATKLKNSRIGNNSEYARMPDGEDDGS